MLSYLEASCTCQRPEGHAQVQKVIGAPIEPSQKRRALRMCGGKAARTLDTIATRERRSEPNPSSLVDSSSTLTRRSQRDATGDRWFARTSGCISSCISSSHMTGGTEILDRYASPREARQFRRRSRMERLGCRLQKLCVCMLAIHGATHGTCRTVHDPLCLNEARNNGD